MPDVGREVLAGPYLENKKIRKIVTGKKSWLGCTRREEKLQELPGRSRRCMHTHMHGHTESSIPPGDSGVKAGLLIRSQRARDHADLITTSPGAQRWASSALWPEKGPRTEQMPWGTKPAMAAVLQESGDL